MFRIIPTKKKKGLCVAYKCPNKHTSRDRFCSKHRHRYTKYTDHLRYTYNLLKSNARARGKVCTITLSDFKAFCEETNYLELKGRLAISGTIDRVDPTKGYVPGNLQILSKSKNSSKRWSDMYPF